MEPIEVDLSKGGCVGGCGGGGKSGEGFIDRSKVRILLCDNDAKSPEKRCESSSPVLLEQNATAAYIPSEPHPNEIFFLGQILSAVKLFLVLASMILLQLLRSPGLNEQLPVDLELKTM
ncbi:unnamed protein product [Ilex paraguariensis]|uniref:Uncharacterized protein n=1 Tax=Ilex paraguariensis TaxID=185542 RepID=A0ABC8TCI0_9AQUA